MKSKPSMLIAASLAGAALLGVAAWPGAETMIGQAQAQPGKAQPSPTFLLGACNRSKVNEIFLAVVQIVGKELKAKGWTKLPKQPNCESDKNFVEIGQLERPSFWFHATDGQDLYWGKPETQICVNLNEHFEYTWGGKDRQCQQGETAIGFMEVKINPKWRAYPLILQ
jgi:hypothetical protein